ncbi:MAG: hypothetical protein SGI87_09320 [Flavobacteriales bacterium]|nr:hypothetical protein [Flavobacteriales bacterium]
MKYQLSLFIPTALLWVSCAQNPVPKESDPAQASSSIDSQTYKVDENKELPKDKGLLNGACNYHRIGFDTLLKYTSAFISDPKLADAAKNVCFGGATSIDILIGKRHHKNLDVFDGFAGWWCWNDSMQNGLPEFFIAFEHHSTHDEFNIQNFPVSDSVSISQNNFTYGGSTANWNEYLLNHTTFPILPDRTVKTADIKNLARYFRYKFPYKYKGGQPYNEYSVAFFRNDIACNTLTEFLNQFENYRFPYVRYYYGLDIHNTANKMRLILVPVDSTGKNIHVHGGQQSHYLQHTFP